MWFVLDCRWTVTPSLRDNRWGTFPEIASFDNLDCRLTAIIVERLGEFDSMGGLIAVADVEMVRRGCCCKGAQNGVNHKTTITFDLVSFMRLIGELDDPQQAKYFTAFLLVKGIETQVDQDAGKSEIWVKDEDCFSEALTELDAFKSNPNDAKYSGSMQQAKTLAREEERKRQQIQKKIVQVSGGVLPKRRPLTMILIVVCAIVSLLTGFGENLGKEGGVGFDHPVYRALQFVSVSPPIGRTLILESQGNYDDLRVRFASIRRGEIWRLFTAIFIHYGIIHLLFNMIWFFQFGTLIEHRYGTLRFGLLVLVIAVISCVFQCAVPAKIGGSSPAVLQSGVLITAFGGMSGVVYGLFGFIWMKSTYDPKFGYRLTQSTVIILIGWLFFCMIPSEMRAGIGFGSSVGNWAHGVGLLVGMAIGYWASIVKS